MDTRVETHLQTVLKHLYINPLEKCNLSCKICYTKKTDPILKEEEILSFVQKYAKTLPLESITFCGGEVFSLSYVPRLINTLTKEGYFIQMITNGTIDKLEQFSSPNTVQIIVSLDGLPDYHDSNRGKGNFQKSISLLKKADEMGFHIEVFSIVTRQNIRDIDTFEAYLYNYLGKQVSVTYHPRKPPAYLLHHPLSNVIGETEGFEFLTKEEMISVMRTRNVFPPKDLGCYQIALVSDGRIFGCCEGITPIGRITDSIETLEKRMKKRLLLWEKERISPTCLGCTQPEFMCGIKSYIQQLHHAQ